jgi:hypothetical protein
VRELLTRRRELLKPFSSGLIGSATCSEVRGIAVADNRGRPVNDHKGVYQESSRRWSLADNESTSLFSSIGNAWSGDPFIESAHDLHEIASQQDERAPQYEGDAIE